MRRHGADFSYKQHDAEIADVQNPAIKFAEKCGWIARRLQWIGRKGAPDTFFVRRGRVLMIEFKAEDGSLSSDQVIEIGELRKAGVEVFVCDNLEDAYALLV